VASPTGAGRDLYRPEALILITHIDADERPETVRWMMQDPHFKLVKQIEGTDPDVTLAFLRLVALDSSQVGGGSGAGNDSAPQRKPRKKASSIGLKQGQARRGGGAEERIRRQQRRLEGAQGLHQANDP